MSTVNPSTPGRVRIPADVEREDRLLANLTARQLAILSVAGVLLWVLYEVLHRLVPLAVFAALATPIVAAALVLALGRMGGMPADRLAMAACRQHRSPRRLVPAPEGMPPAPAMLAAPAVSLPAPLRLPFVGIDDDGAIDLGPDGKAVVCRASAVAFSLRTPVEQEALVAGFARYLNSLNEPVQFVLRAEPVDLRPVVADLESRAPGLPHPGLEAAAVEYASFLTDLGARHELLRRDVLLVLREPPGEGLAGRLRRRADEAASALSSAGVRITVLGTHEAEVCLRSALDPWSGFLRVGAASGVISRSWADRDGGPLRQVPR